MPRLYPDIVDLDDRADVKKMNLWINLALFQYCPCKKKPMQYAFNVDTDLSRM